MIKAITLHIKYCVQRILYRQKLLTLEMYEIMVCYAKNNYESSPTQLLSYCLRDIFWEYFKFLEYPNIESKFRLFCGFMQDKIIC